MLVRYRTYEEVFPKNCPAIYKIAKIGSCRPCVKTDRFGRRIDKDTHVDDERKAELALVTAEEEHIDIPCEKPGASEVEPSTNHQPTRCENHESNALDTVMLDLGAYKTTSPVTHSGQIHTSPAASESSSFSRPKSSSLQSVVLSVGCYTATDAFTTAPSANPPGQKSIGHEPRILTEFDASTVGLPPNVNREYASAFARCLKEAVGITDEQTSFLVASDSTIANTLQTYASMLGSSPGTQHHTAVKFVHRQRK
jgi:hypothetical protein